ncbi:ketol-acid reductoisomerase [Halobacteriales archaeon QS_1_68_17]|nr:MAG: ketol-acid reductoisomerase [Halobacteriales archaeon QS_1_68_17]
MPQQETTVYRDEDADLSVLDDRTIAIVGYGNQGRAQALNLRDSGVDDVVVGNREDSSWEQAEADGFPVYGIGEAVDRADVIFLLVPDEVQPEIYRERIEPNLEAGDVLNFASGYNITYGFIDPPESVDVVMVAPRMIGETVRELYLEDDGAPALVAVDQDASGEAEDVVLGLAKGIGATRSGAIDSDFESETVTDLMTEQALFPVFVNALLTKYEVEVEAGVAPETVLMEQYLSKEMSHIFEKAATMGLVEQLSLHSQTSQYGQLRFAAEFDRGPLREFMQGRLEEIRNGRFATEWTLEQQADYPQYGRLHSQFQDAEMFRKEQETMDRFDLHED